MYLRPYRRANLEALYALDCRCFGPRFRFSRANMREVAEGFGAFVVLACELEAGTELLLGFCAATLHSSPAAGYGYLATLDVAPEWRGRGLGQRLLQWAEEACSSHGASEMRLHVHAENDAAIRLYERNGYVPSGRVNGFYGRGVDALVFSKELAGTTAS